MAFDYSTVDLQKILQRVYNEMSQLQRDGVARGRTSRRILFNVWMGIGKTLMGLTLGFCHRPQNWLIIGSKGAIATWQAEIQKWFPEFSDPKLFCVVEGTAIERQQCYQRAALFYATTSASFNRDIKWLATKKVKFDVISIDEIHKHGYRNRKSETVKNTIALIRLCEKHLGRDLKLINPMTGTWTSKAVPQQYAVLNILAPKKFSSYWNHINKFCILVKGVFGTEIIGPKNTEQLAIDIHPYVYTVTKEEAEKELPPIHRIRLNTELPKKLQNHFDSMLEELFYETESGDVVSVTTKLAAYTKLRQMINCPASIDPAWGPGPAIEVCVDKMKESDELPNWRHNLVFTPFLAAIPHFKAYLADELKLPQEKILVAQGGISIEELHALEEEFRRDPNTCWLASLKYSQAWNAETTLNCYFPHFDWDQDENFQAEARSRRKSGKQDHINSYYVDIKNTITGEMFHLLNRKTSTNQMTYKDIALLQEKLKQEWESRHANATK